MLHFDPAICISIIEFGDETEEEEEGVSLLAELQGPLNTFWHIGLQIYDTALLDSHTSE